MIVLLCFFLTLFASPFKSKSRLEAENAALRHQLIVLRRRVRGRVHLTNGDRLFLVQMYRWFPSESALRLEGRGKQRLERVVPSLTQLAATSSSRSGTAVDFTSRWIG